MRKLSAKDAGRIFAVVACATALAMAADEPTIPAGTTLHAQLTQVLSTKSSENGDPFTASVTEPIFQKGYEVIPAGSTIEGHVTYVKPPGRAKGVAEMRLVIDTVMTPDHTKYAISAALQQAEGAKVNGQEGTITGPGKATKGAAKEAGIEAGAGAGIGAIADGGTGALYGAGAGLLVGVIHTLAKRHKDITLPIGTELTFVTSRAMTGKKPPTPAGPAD